MKVLVVDDAGISRHRLVRMLENLGHEALPAATGNEGLGILRSDSSVGIVVCDLMMPGMGGMEFIQKAREIERFDDEGCLPPLQFLLMTYLRPENYAGPKGTNLAQDARNAGFFDVVFKPVDVEELCTKFAEMAAVQLLAGLEVAGDQERASEILKSLNGVLDRLNTMLAESDASACADLEQSHDVVTDLQEAANQIVLKRDTNAAQTLRTALRKTVEGLEKLVAQPAES